MAYVGDIFEAAMGLMDELSAEGEAQTSDTAEYVLRTPAIINMLVGELKMLTGEREDWLPVESLDDAAPVADASYALSALPYGLAAHLLLGENDAMANYFSQRYSEMYAAALRSLPSEFEEIPLAYGGLNV